jgi:uncharacterized membrane protein
LEAAATVPSMKEWAGRLIGYVFIGSFCLAGPLLVMLALVTAAQRTALVISGLRAQATVIGARQSGSSRPTYAPVFQFTASDGRSYTVSSDVYAQESAIHFGGRLQVLYWPDHPESARIDAFAPLWILPLVLGVVGGGFSVVPAIVLVSWMRRRAERAEPDKREAALVAADTVSRRLLQTLGAVLIAAGGALLASGIGLIPAGSRLNGAHIPAAAMGTLLAACGLQVGQWVTNRRLSALVGGVVAASLALLFGWVALYGDAAGFHGAIGVGGRAAGWSGSHVLGRVLFGSVAILTALLSLWSWKQAFRSR